MPKAIKRARCFKIWEEHDGYRPTGETETEILPHKVQVWKVYRCQCGERKSLHR